MTQHQIHPPTTKNGQVVVLASQALEKQQFDDLNTFMDNLRTKGDENTVGRFLTMPAPSALGQHIAAFAHICPFIFIGMPDIVRHLRESPMKQESGELPPTTEQIVAAMAELGFVKIPDSLSLLDDDGQPLHIWMASKIHSMSCFAEALICKFRDEIDRGCISCIKDENQTMSDDMLAQHPIDDSPLSGAHSFWF